jgi:plasmid maintenance system killer protein
MEVSFEKGKLHKICNSDKKLRGEYGARMAEIIKERLSELVAVEVLADMRTIPRARCHELTGNLKGLLAVDLIHPKRLVFRPFDKPIPRMPDGGLNWSEVRQIEIVGIGDYHH